jgi:hypothetical protein
MEHPLCMYRILWLLCGRTKNTIKHRVGCTSKWSPGPSAIFHPKSESAVSFYACLDGYRMTGWWFGTFFSPYIRNNDPNWRSHIFQRCWSHQPDDNGIKIQDLTNLTPLSNRTARGVSCFWRDTIGFPVFDIAHCEVGRSWCWTPCSRSCFRSRSLGL